VIICKYFNENNVPYVIIGGVAVLFQGRFRTTEDIDIVIFGKKLNINSFVHFCKDNELSIEQYELEEGLKNGSHVSILDIPDRLRIDLKGAKSTWDVELVKDSETFQYKNIIFRVAKPEYLIANKLYKGSEIDLEDALSVYFRNKDRINLDLLNRLVSMLEVIEEFRTFLAKAESYKD
jgi:hypothetical protein